MSDKHTTTRGKSIRISMTTFELIDAFKRSNNYKSYENVVNDGLRALYEKKKKKNLSLSDFGFR